MIFTNNHRFREITGAALNALHLFQPFYQFVATPPPVADQLHMFCPYFTPYGSNQSGGFYFTTEQRVHRMFFPGAHLCRVSIPHDARCYIESHTIKANKIVLHPALSPIPTTICDAIVTHKQTDDTMQYVGATAFQDPVQRCSAIQTDALLLQWIPAPLRDATLCGHAVKRDGRALAFVPHQHKTRALCLEALHHAYGHASVFNSVPIALRDVDLVRVAIATAGLSLGHLAEPLRTFELCSRAVQQNGLALQFVPLRLRTAELCLLAVQNDGALKLTQYTCRSPGLYISPEDRALKFVPLELQTADLCFEAVAQNGLALPFVPEVLKSPHLFRAAFQTPNLTATSILSLIPPAALDSDLCLAAVTSDSREFRQVPPALLTPELCHVAIQHNPALLSLVPDALKSADLCELALRRHRERPSTFPWCPDLVGPFEIVKPPSSAAAAEQALHQYLTEDNRHHC